MLCHKHTHRFGCLCFLPFLFCFSFRPHFLRCLRLLCTKTQSLAHNAFDMLFCFVAFFVVVVYFWLFAHSKVSLIIINCIDEIERTNERSKTKNTRTHTHTHSFGQEVEMSYREHNRISTTDAQLHRIDFLWHWWFSLSLRMCSCVFSRVNENLSSSPMLCVWNMCTNINVNMCSSLCVCVALCIHSKYI